MKHRLAHGAKCTSIYKQSKQLHNSEYLYVYYDSYDDAIHSQVLAKGNWINSDGITYLASVTKGMTISDVEQALIKGLYERGII